MDTEHTSACWGTLGLSGAFGPVEIFFALINAQMHRFVLLRSEVQLEMGRG